MPTSLAGQPQLDLVIVGKVRLVVAISDRVVATGHLHLTMWLDLAAISYIRPLLAVVGHLGRGQAWPTREGFYYFKKKLNI